MQFLPAGDVDACLQQLLHAGDAAPLRLRIAPPLEHQIGRGVHDHVDAGLPHEPDHPVGVVLLIARERAGVAGGDPPLPAVFHGLLGQHLQRLGMRVVGLVHVHVDIGVVVRRHLEGERDVPGAVGRRILVEGHAADQIGAHLHRLPHQIVGALVLEDALLREGDDLYVRDVAGALARLQHAFERA